MMNTSESRGADRHAGLRMPVLSMLLGFVVIYVLVAHGYFTMNEFWGARGGSASFALAMNLLIVGAIWGLSRSVPTPGNTIGLLVLLLFAALLGIGATVTIIKNLPDHHLPGLSYGKSWGLLAGNLLVYAGAIRGLLVLKPWTAFKGSSELVSPATRRTQLLFGLSGLISILAVVAAIIGVQGHEGTSLASWKSLNISPGFAIAAMAIWLLSIAIAWWWYYSADEHERRANDVGFLFGGGLFMAATPVWWIASRAGLAPPPDAMVLWCATIVAMGLGWWWYRSR